MPSIQLYLAAATTTHIKPTAYHHMTTTSTAIVETPLDSRAQPVATENAIPSTESHLPLVIGKNQLPQYCYYYRVMYIQSSDIH